MKTVCVNIALSKVKGYLYILCKQLQLLTFTYIIIIKYYCPSITQYVNLKQPTYYHFIVSLCGQIGKIPRLSLL